MNNQLEKARLFHSLHVKGEPLVILNIWDAGSAKAMEEAGANVIATSSWSVAAAHGFEDGEKLPFHLSLANLERIIANVNVPVTFDFEGGYGKQLQELKDNARKVIAVGAVGVNFEDQIIGERRLYSINDQCARIHAICNVGQDASIPLFINARTDLFLHSSPADHGLHIDEALHRAKAYADSEQAVFLFRG